MKRSVIALAFALCFATSTWAGEIPSGDFAAPPPPPASTPKTTGGPSKADSQEELDAAQTIVLALLDLIF